MRSFQHIIKINKFSKIALHLKMSFVEPFSIVKISLHLLRVFNYKLFHMPIHNRTGQLCVSPRGRVKIFNGHIYRRVYALSISATAILQEDCGTKCVLKIMVITDARTIRCKDTELRRRGCVFFFSPGEILWQGYHISFCGLARFARGENYRRSLVDDKSFASLRVCQVRINRRTLNNFFFMQIINLNSYKKKPHFQI